MGEPVTEQCRRAHEYRRAGRVQDAEAAYRALLDRVPGHEEAALSLAFLLREQGRIGAAVGVVQGWWSTANRDRDNGLKLLGFLVEMGSHADALPVAEALAEWYPDDAVVQEQAGFIAQANGEFALASACLRNAVALDPARAGAWLRLAHTRRFEEQTDPDLARMRDRAATPGLPAPLRVSLEFALGKALDDLGEHARATDHWRRANGLAIEVAGPLTPASPIEVDEWPTIEVATEGRAPLFVVGMPRSGTTLLARQLATHPQVRDRGELNWLPLLVQRLGSRPSADDVRQAREFYLAQLFRDDAPARWYLDKNPLNYRHLPAIARLFPEARVLHCRRSPRDVALSLWSQYFAHADMRWSLSFDGMEAEFRRYRDAMRGTESSPCMDVDYRDLVESTQSTTRLLHDWLGLALDESLDVAGVAIATASIWQARQPVYRSSLERWRHYLPFVPELERFEPG